MKYVQKIVKPDGKVHLYLRKKGLPSITLKSPWPADGAEKGSDLEREVNQLIKELTGDAPLPGTFKEAATAYELKSAEFRILADSTKALYLPMVYEMVEDIGHIRLEKFTPDFVRALRDAWAERGYQAANHRLQVIKNILIPHIANGTIDKNPFEFLKGVRRPHELDEPHIIWPAWVVETVIMAAKGKGWFGLARAVVIARFAGARRGDLVKLPKTTRQDGRFKFLSGKKRVPVDIPEDPELTRWLNALPVSQPPSKWQKHSDKKRGVVRLLPSTLVYNTRNGRYTPHGLYQALDGLVAELAALGVIDSAEYDLHGLRHTRGVELALAGASDAQGAAQLGHASPASFQKYRRQADRIRMSNDAQTLIDALRLKQAGNAGVNGSGNAV